MNLSSLPARYRRGHRRLGLLGAALVAAIATLSPAGPALAATGGAISPGWHWTDSGTTGGPTASSVDISRTGSKVPIGFDYDAATVSSPFDLRLNGVTSRDLTISPDAWLAIGEAGHGATLRVLTSDMHTGAAWWQVVGAPGSRQLVVQLQDAIRYYNNGVRTSAVITFYEGVPGALVTYHDVGSRGDTSVGLTDAWGDQPPTSTVNYLDGDLSEGLAIWWTSATRPAPPAGVVPDSDAFGYHALAGQPTGYADLGDTGRVVASGDSGQRRLDLPFGVTFYGTEYQVLTVGTDGSFGFGTPNPPMFGDLPNAGAPDSGAIFNADLISTISTQVRGTAPHRQYVVQWTGHRYGWNGPDGLLDMEMVLFEDGDDIGFAYADVPGTGIVALNHDGRDRYQVASPVDGDRLLFSLAGAATHTIEPNPATGTSTDGYGYRAVRSSTPSTPGTPVYDYVDATTGGTPVLTGDEGVVSVTTPFPVHLYGVDSSTLTVNANGHLYLGSIDHGATSYLPDAGHGGLVQPFASDLVMNPGVFTTTVGTAPHRRFVVEWNGHRYGASAIPARYEVVLAEDSTDVTVQYASIEALVGPSGGAPAAINKDAETRLTWSRDGRDLTDHSAVLLTTDRLLGLDPPAQLRTDGVPVDLGNHVTDVAETATAHVRQSVSLDGVSGLAPGDVHLQAYSQGSWSDLPLSAVDDRLVATVTPTDGSAFVPGGDLSTPLRLAVSPDSPLGSLSVTSTLSRLVDGSPDGVIAQSTRSVALTATAPDAPTAVAVTPGNASADVAWTPASNGGRSVTGWTVTATPGGATAPVGANATHATVSGLVNGTEYSFAVTATNAVGDSSAGSATGTPYTTPTAPGTPSATAATDGSGTATVSWTPASGRGRPVTGYTVVSSPGNRVVTVDGAHTSAVVGGLTNGIAYTFAVTATNLAGAGAASPDSAAVTPLGTPSRPTGVAATATSRHAHVTWSAPASTGGTPVTGYTVRAHPVGATSSASDLTLTAAATDREVTLAGLSNGTAYAVTVTAANAVGTGPASQTSTVTPVLDPVIGLAVTGTMTPQGGLGADAAWALPADATGAIVCVTAGTSPAPPTCDGVTASDHVTVPVTVPAPSLVTVTVYAVDGGPRSRATSVTLTRSALTSTPARKTVKAGTGVTLTGTLAGAPDGANPASLWSRPAQGGTWKRVSVVTSSTGIFRSAALQPTSNTAYQWRYAGGSGVLGSVSGTSGVAVAPAITTALSPPTIKKGTSSVAWGTLTPALAGQQVQLQRKAGTKWVSAGSAVIKKQTMPGGSTLTGYRVAVPGSTTGSFTYRVRYTGSATNAAATGPSVVLTVK